MKHFVVLIKKMCNFNYFFCTGVSGLREGAEGIGKSLFKPDHWSGSFLLQCYNLQEPELPCGQCYHVINVTRNIAIQVQQSPPHQPQSLNKTLYIFRISLWIILRWIDTTQTHAVSFLLFLDEMEQVAIIIIIIVMVIADVIQIIASHHLHDRGCQGGWQRRGRLEAGR